MKEASKFAAHWAFLSASSWDMMLVLVWVEHAMMLDDESLLLLLLSVDSLSVETQTVSVAVYTGPNGLPAGNNSRPPHPS